MSGRSKAYNINVGVLGHVDAGKTQLVAALSTQLSTAALDKHPQSKERGITLDLGFSSFTTPLPPGREALKSDALQITLVDCPGHASLVRTILGGAQIMDMMLLVIDVTKGIQRQTAECLVVGELTTDKLIVVLNKIDLLSEASRAKIISKAEKMCLKTLAFTNFKSPPIVAISAKSECENKTESLGKLTEKILEMVPFEPRKISGSFLMSVDHCFAVKGHGTVLTGTVLQGLAKVNDTMEIPHLKEQRKIKSMQMFKKPHQACSQGDRVGICVTQIDPDKMERGWLCQPGTIQSFSTAIAKVEKIKFFTGEINSKQKLHITIGHSTVMADVDFFGLSDSHSLFHSQAKSESPEKRMHFDTGWHYFWQEKLYGTEGRPCKNNSSHHGPQWCLLKFSQPVLGPLNALLIGSRLDDVSSGESCRLAMHGRIISSEGKNQSEIVSDLKVYKIKSKQGILDRVLPDGRTAVCRGLFKKESDISIFDGMKVKSGCGAVGVIQGKFGTSGKVKIWFAEGLPKDWAEKNSVVLEFKKFIMGLDRKHLSQ